MTDQKTLKNATIESVIRVLTVDDEPLTAATMYRLSDINGDDLKKLQTTWGSIPAERRLLLIQRLGEVAETNFDMNFIPVVRLALTDLDDELRQAAVEASWIDESAEMLNRLLPLAKDRSSDVRAATASALGRFILLGELGKFDAGLTRLAQNVVLRLYNDPAEPIEVRRRALEAIANSSHPDVEGMISECYKRGVASMKASAVFAMGRSCDDQWAATVLKELDSADAEMRYEAARAAGELELRAAVPQLGRMLDEDDREVMEMAVWSLGEIGGTRASRLLEDRIERAESEKDEDLVEAIHEALDSASLVGDHLSFD
jgi:HEAT repeat protein